MKYAGIRDDIAEFIRSQTSPYNARKIGLRYASYRREDWDRAREVKLERVLKLKLEQHPILKTKLRDTRTRTLIHVYNDKVCEPLLSLLIPLMTSMEQNDSFWGRGTDGRGQNRLGKAWMNLRIARWGA